MSMLGKMLGLSPRKAAALATPAGWANWIHPDDLPVYRRAVAAGFKGETARYNYVEWNQRSESFRRPARTTFSRRCGPGLL